MNEKRFRRFDQIFKMIGGGVGFLFVREMKSGFFWDRLKIVTENNFFFNLPDATVVKSTDTRRTKSFSSDDDIFR